eukprot:NODE_279_length_11907_cov_0.265244.p7 type:complete len:141 gc:universal NODE_279_length_11907_cov_0.265244:4399-3977(-)
MSINKSKPKIDMLFANCLFSIPQSAPVAVERLYGKIQQASFYNAVPPQKFKCETHDIPEDNLYAAVSKGLFEMSMCGEKVKVVYNGASVDVPVLDECEGCADDKIDLSEVAWKILQPDTGKGVLGLVNDPFKVSVEAVTI